METGARVRKSEVGVKRNSGLRQSGKEGMG